MSKEVKSLNIKNQIFKDYKTAQTGIEHFIKEFLFQFIGENTKRAYTKDLKAFFNFAKENGETITSPDQLKAYHFQAYRDQLLEKEYTSATINRKLVSIRSFVKWAIALGHLSHNPLDAVKLPKVQTEAPTIAFSDDEVARILAAPKQNTVKDMGHKLVLYFLFHLGLRRDELCKIKLKDFHEEEGHLILQIKGKGKKIREMPLNYELKDILEKYLIILNQFNMQLEYDDYLIQLNNKKINAKPINGTTVYRIINKYAQICDIHKRISPHSCRATVISHLLDTKKIPIRDVATFAGHGQITTTERYDKRRKNIKNSPSYFVSYLESKKKSA